MLSQKHRRLLFWCAYATFFIWLLPTSPSRNHESPLSLFFGKPALQLERPTWDQLKQWELDLPQHNLDLPLPEGRDGRYVHFVNQGVGQEWSHQLHEMSVPTRFQGLCQVLIQFLFFRLILAHLAHKYKRSYVFHDYRWNLDHFPWAPEMLPDTERKDLPRTPATAFISGPAVGGSWGLGDGSSPRAISETWWSIVCPPEERTRIQAERMKADMPHWADSEHADILLPAWEKALNGSQRCIEVSAVTKGKDRQSQTFIDIWGSGANVLSMWEELRRSPISRYTTASELVLSAVKKNQALFQTRRGKFAWKATPSANDAANLFDRMLAVHVQRGDSFKQDCMGAAEQNSSFYGWNQLPQLPDRFQRPVGPEWRRGTPDNIALFIKHCYPDDDFVYTKIREAKLEYEATAEPNQPRTLDVLFLLTNEKPDWQKAMKRILLQAG